MSPDVYEVVAQAMRYWFIALGALIVWRTYRCLRQERKARHRWLRSLPDAGMIGEWVVERGSAELREGMAVAVPWEGVLGSRRICDVYVPVDGVAHSHLYFEFLPKKGLRLTPARNLECMLNGSPVTWRTARKAPAFVHSGDTLTVGDAVLQLQLFPAYRSGTRPTAEDPDANPGSDEASAAPLPGDAPAPPVSGVAPAVYPVAAAAQPFPVADPQFSPNPDPVSLTPDQWMPGTVQIPGSVSPGPWAPPQAAQAPAPTPARGTGGVYGRYPAPNAFAERKRGED